MMLFGLVVTLGAAPRVSLTPRLRSEPSGQAEGPDGRATAPAHRTRVEQRLNDPVRWPTGLRTAQAPSSSHHVPIDYPDVVADAILSVLDSYREIANNKKRFGG